MASTISCLRMLTVGMALVFGAPSLAQPSPPADEEAEQPVVHIPAALDEEARAAVAGMNRFTIDLYRQTLPESGNHFISPASVSVAMALVYRGAAGSTADEIARVLRYPTPPADYLRAAGQIQTSMNFSGPQRGLATANAIWIDRSMQLQPSYQSDLGRLMGAAAEQADFGGNPEAARLTINRWVAEQTRDRITDLLPPQSINPLTRAALVNTIYWKGAWAEPFAAETTRDEPFFQADRQQRTVPLMVQQGSFQAVEVGGIKAINLPYAGNEVAMTVILPSSPTGLARFEARLDHRNFAQLLRTLDGSTPRTTLIHLPRFSLASGSVELTRHLTAMGIVEAFGDAAAFPNIVANGAALSIGSVIHQANIDVDESGSEAAAATAILMDIMVTGTRRPPPPFIFRADHPFLFMLRDRRTGLILFIGRYG